LAGKVVNIATDTKNKANVLVEGLGCNFEEDGECEEGDSDSEGKCERQHPFPLSSDDLKDMLSDVKSYVGDVMLPDLSNTNHLKKDQCIIINTDDSGPEGTHWVCAINKRSLRYMFYFDSFGLPADDRVKNFLLRSQKPIVFSNSQLQRSSTVTCGYFCMKVIREIMENNSDPYDVLMEFDQTPSDENENAVIENL
jgi:hypothetical protein